MAEKAVNQAGESDSFLYHLTNKREVNCAGLGGSCSNNDCCPGYYCAGRPITGGPAFPGGLRCCARGCSLGGDFLARCCGF